MITRDVAQLQVVPALVHNARFHSCTVAGFTCYTDGATSAIGTSEFFPGFIIDRLGLAQSFNSMAVVPTVYGTFGSTGAGAGDFVICTLSAGLMHACTSGGTFTAYSTGNWLVNQPIWRQSTATSTGLLYFTPVQNDVGLSTEIGLGGVAATATSTGAGATLTAGTSSTSFIYYSGGVPVFSLGGAKRFVKVVVRPRFETSACGSGAVFMSAAAVFGEPDFAQPAFNQVKRILVTSGCST